MEILVKFTVPATRLTTSQDALRYVKLLEDVFSYAFPTNVGDVDVITTPDLFGLFLVERNSRGFQNQFSELRPVLFHRDDPVPQRITIDVAGTSPRPRPSPRNLHVVSQGEL